ncbi:hypothetical protein RM844_15735 [Streptomyces sp. DSM 44915]|uniref:Lipoprotein n=1 Tax=Streptomyces chisholmiae TaxID=3075540 RepID=A0ABU2JRX3_9ACTN|nr:hypothetical protein [Streptomyces sp. DSM 44915]MDT0267735.1 hypothetical protein [Streptomyces sp. DSM 44915]
MRSRYRLLTGIAGVALLAGTAACGSEDGSDAEGRGGERNGSDVTDISAALQAAAETTAGMNSARFEGEMTAPAAAGGSMTMTGVMSWQPALAMEMNITSDELAGTPGAPEEMVVRWVDNVMFMNMGPEFQAEMDGREWLSMDLNAIAEESGDPAMADAMAMGLESTNQDPAQQIAMLLSAPGIEEVGEESVNGVQTRRFSGTMSVEDALAQDQSGVTELLTEEEQRQLVTAMEQQGIESYDIDVWIDGSDLPVQIRQAYDTAEGPVEYEVRYSDFNTDVSVEEPAANTVLDFMELLAEFQVEADSLA